VVLVRLHAGLVLESWEWVFERGVIRHGIVRLSARVLSSFMKCIPRVHVPC
jgi:hypothetical protein